MTTLHHNLLSDMVRTGNGTLRVSHLQYGMDIQSTGCLDAPDYIHAGSLCGGCYGPMLRVVGRDG